MYATIKITLSVLCLIAAPLMLCGLIGWLATLVHDRENQKKRNRYGRLAIGGFLSLAVFMLGYFACATKQYAFRMEELPTFAVRSDSLENGVWKDVISNTERGENRSPSLTWEPVDGASRYAIVMVDETVDWLHWAATDVQTTALSEGQLLDGSEYVGPYPPSGTHTYTVYVFALRYETYALSAQVDAVCAGIVPIAEELDGSPYTDMHNIISYGKLSGTYSHR